MTLKYQLNTNYEAPHHLIFSALLLLPLIKENTYLSGLLRTSEFTVQKKLKECIEITSTVYNLRNRHCPQITYYVK